MYSHNQIIGLLTRMAQAHKQIKSFGFGDDFDITNAPLLYDTDSNANQNPSHVLLWGVLKSSLLNNSNPATAAELQTVYTLIVCDKVQPNDSNRDEIMSDTQQICLDLIAMFQSGAYDNYFYVNKTAALTPFSGLKETDDGSIGWTFDLVIRQPYTSDYCAVPGTIPSALPN